MYIGVSRELKTRDRIEEDLRKVLLQRHSEWIQASDKKRDEARQRFLEALRSFTGFVLDGRPRPF